MFKSIIVLVCSMGIMHAGLLDFWNAHKAKEAYTQGDYAKATSLYQNLDQTQDAASYNLGNAYYKEKAYEKALEAYQHVKEPSLLPQTLHNIGNAYAQLHQNDKAIAAYESALKLKEDKDTRFNLELLKKQQKNKEQKQNNPSDKNQKNDNAQKSSSKDQPKDNNASNNSSNSEPQQNKPSQNEPNNNAQDANASAQQQTPKKPEEKPSSDKQKAQNEADKKGGEVQADEQNTPISTHEERQWDKMLNQRGVNTLMLPLSNKGKNDENTKPW